MWYTRCVPISFGRWNILIGARTLIEHIKMQRSHKGRIYSYPVTIERSNSRIMFLDADIKLKDEIKSMKGSHWHGRDEKPVRMWSIENCCRNNFQLEYLSGGNPYEHFDQPLQVNKFDRPLFDHQKTMANHILTYNYGILAAEMGVGKTRMYIAAALLQGNSKNLIITESKLIDEFTIELKQ